MNSCCSVFLAVEELHHCHAADAFGQEGVEVGQARPDLTEGFAHLEAEGEDDIEKHWQHDEGDQGKLQVHPEHDPDDADQNEDVADDGDYAGGEHLSQNLHIAGYPRHQAAGGGPVHKRRGKALDVGEKFHAEIEHDPLPQILEEIDFQVGQEPSAMMRAKYQKTAAGPCHFAGGDMAVDGNLDEPGLGELGRRDQGQQEQAPDNHPPVGAQVADKPGQELAVVGLADYFIFVDTAEMHNTPVLETRFPQSHCCTMERNAGHTLCTHHTLAPCSP